MKIITVDIAHKNVENIGITGEVLDVGTIKGRDAVRLKIETDYDFKECANLVINGVEFWPLRIIK